MSTSIHNTVKVQFNFTGQDNVKHNMAYEKQNKSSKYLIKKTPWSEIQTLESLGRIIEKSNNNYNILLLMCFSKRIEFLARKLSVLELTYRTTGWKISVGSKVFIKNDAIGNGEINFCHTGNIRHLLIR